MGNRAIVKPEGKSIGVYLHWNGGIDSVTAFLEYCKLKGYRDFGGKNADSYGIAKFCQVVGNFFGGTTSIGVETNVYESEECARGLDNGIYVIDGWDIAKRIGSQSSPEGYDLQEMLLEIDSRQPIEEQLGEEYIKAEVVDVSEIKIGDKVFVSKWEDKPEIHTVVGIAPPNTFHNEDVSNLPYVDLYERDGDYSWNCNNYLKGKVRRFSNQKENSPDPLTFRMDVTIRFDKKIKNNLAVVEYVSMIMNGKSKAFGFESVTSFIDEEDSTLLHIECKNPDFECFKDLETITQDDLENITKIEDFSLETDDMEEYPVGIESIDFILPYDDFKKISVSEKVINDFNKSVLICNINKLISYLHIERHSGDFKENLHEIYLKLLNDTTLKESTLNEVVTYLNVIISCLGYNYEDCGFILTEDNEVLALDGSGIVSLSEGFDFLIDEIDMM